MEEQKREWEREKILDDPRDRADSCDRGFAGNRQR